MADDPAVLALMARLPVDHIAEEGIPMVIFEYLLAALSEEATDRRAERRKRMRGDR
jgi:hypothetical protein